jgi:hypothetical protein
MDGLKISAGEHGSPVSFAGVKLRDDRLLLAPMLAAMAVYYAFVLSDGRFVLFHPVGNGLTFNTMLLHLLHGRFDVDPVAVGQEGFLRDGRIYAYWGIVCALLRLPLLAWPGAIKTDVTTLSCLLGVCAGGYFKLRSLLLVRRYCPPSPARDLLVTSAGIWLVFGGAQIGFLRVSLYQEVVFWSGAIAAAFVYVGIRGLLREDFSKPDLAWMAALAGLAVNTRVSMGIGLCAAFGLLLVVLMLEDSNPAGEERRLMPRLRGAAVRRRALAPVAILSVFILVAAVVNIGRWGNPLVFADYNRYLFNIQYPDRLARTQAYGLFNSARIPLGLIYYFFPLWAFRRGDGTLMFSEDRDRLIDALEMPPMSFLLTDALPLVLVIGLCWTGAVLRRPSPTRAGAIAAGLAIPPVLMLMAISMNYRYRMEFYPLIEFATLLSIYRLASDHAARRISTGLPRNAIIAATAISVASANLALLLYKLSFFGPAQMHLKAGLIAYYTDAFFRRMLH